MVPKIPDRFLQVFNIYIIILFFKVQGRINWKINTKSKLRMNSLAYFLFKFVVNSFIIGFDWSTLSIILRNSKANLYALKQIIIMLYKNLLHLSLIKMIHFLWLDCWLSKFVDFGMWLEVYLGNHWVEQLVFVL